MVTHQARSQKLDLRLTSDAKRTVVEAASVAGQSVSECVLESALTRAEDILPDRRPFVLNTEQWTEFMAALDAPPRDLPRLRRLMSEPSFFDVSESE